MIPIHNYFVNFKRLNEFVLFIKIIFILNVLNLGTFLFVSFYYNYKNNLIYIIKFSYKLFSKYTNR